MLHLVQIDNVEVVQLWNKRAEECEDEVKKNEEHLKKLESEKRQYEGKLEWSSGIVLVLSRVYFEE